MMYTRPVQLVLAMSERSLVAIGVPAEAIARERAAMEHVEIGATASQTVAVHGASRWVSIGRQ
jgi:hypothetical protein